MAISKSFSPSNFFNCSFSSSKDLALITFPFQFRQPPINFYFTKLVCDCPNWLGGLIGKVTE